MELQVLTNPLSNPPPNGVPHMDCFLQHAQNPPPNEALQKTRTVFCTTSTKPQKRPLPPNVAIEPTTPATLPSLRRLITLLLPIRYPESFYKESVADTTSSSLSHVALWCEEKPHPLKRKRPSSSPQPPTIESNPIASLPTVIAGIQCRLEPLVVQSPTSGPEQLLYIQTLATLSPYRNLGIASYLLDSIIATTVKYHHNVKEIYAHVWEANHEALEWYIGRGFEVDKEVVRGYYRRLRPAGARLVRRRIGVVDWLSTMDLRTEELVNTDNKKMEKEDESLIND